MEAAIVDVDELIDSIWWEIWVPFYYMSCLYITLLRK
jgi:hypothetical protein